MKDNYSILLKVLILGTVALALGSNINECVKERKYHQIMKGADDLSLYDEKLKLFREMLPVGGTVGYVDDNQYDIRSFCIVQYALSPLIVVKSSDHQFVVANFRNPDSHDQFYMENNARLLGKVDERFRLYKKE